MFIVDKEPPGLRGEVMRRWSISSSKGAACSRHSRRHGRTRSPRAGMGAQGSKEALARYYDEIWVYGLKEIYEPLAALDLGPEIEQRITYTGYLSRELPQESTLSRYPKITRQPFVSSPRVGGGDGDDLIDWVISAY
jgi:predicted glycosyltransferase